jgi:hypothetical protein
MGGVEQKEHDKPGSKVLGLRATLLSLITRQFKLRYP